MDGKYRENLMTNSLFKWGEKATRTTGCAEDGILCYNFCLNTNKSSIQPSGAMNVNKFSKVQFTFNTRVTISHSKIYDKIFISHFF